MVDKVEVRATEIPGMQITFQGPLGPDGLGIAFQVAVDSTIDRRDLDELLDRVGGARRRQAAMEELPIVRQSLAANLKLLETAKREKEVHIARMQGRVTQLGARRRGEVANSPQDVNALSQHDQRILQIEGQIAGAQERIPYLEALIDRREPDPVEAPARMAAE